MTWLFIKRLEIFYLLGVCKLIKVILHIGRHKTGTSSLQRFLFENPELLLKNKLNYPNIYIKNIAHHELAESLRKNTFDTLPRSIQDKSISQFRERLIESLSNPELTYIISSEAFQNVEPKVVRQVFDPEFFKVRVVCYFREQLTYLASAYNQRVHATDYEGSIYSYYRDCFRANYFLFAESWSEYFDSLIFRIYERESLRHHDLIADFMSHAANVTINVDDAAIKHDHNPSLSQHFLRIKLALNRMARQGLIDVDLQSKTIYRKLGQLSHNAQSKSYRVPFVLAIFVYFHFYLSNKKFLNKYLPQERFKFKVRSVSLWPLSFRYRTTLSEVKQLLSSLRDDSDGSF